MGVFFRALTDHILGGDHMWMTGTNITKMEAGNF